MQLAELANTAHGAATRIVDEYVDAGISGAKERRSSIAYYRKCLSWNGRAGRCSYVVLKQAKK
jgi:hypothetical protein